MAHTLEGSIGHSTISKIFNDPRFNVMCGLDGCSSTFRTFSAFYSHIYRRHRSSGIVTSEKYAFQRAVALPEQCSNQLEDGMDTSTADTDHPLYDDDRVPGEFLLSWHVAWYLSKCNGQQLIRMYRYGANNTLIFLPYLQYR